VDQIPVTLLEAFEAEFLMAAAFAFAPVERGGAFESTDVAKVVAGPRPANPALIGHDSDGNAVSRTFAAQRIAVHIANEGNPIQRYAASSKRMGRRRATVILKRTEPGIAYQRGIGIARVKTTAILDQIMPDEGQSSGVGAARAIPACRFRDKPYPERDTLD
jgi:hypothetical protein